MEQQRTIRLLLVLDAGLLSSDLCKSQAYFAAQHKSYRVSFLAVQLFLLLSGRLGIGAIVA